MIQLVLILASGSSQFYLHLQSQQQSLFIDQWKNKNKKQKIMKYPFFYL